MKRSWLAKSILPKPKKPKTKKPKQLSQGEETFALHLRAHALEHEFVRELKFHKEREWLFDFAKKEYMLAIEIEGGTEWGKSRHSKGKGFEDDCRKYNTATGLGWKVCRFSTQMVMSGEAIAFVVDLVRALRCQQR
jgi:very-short-patch-repair endonuclease